MAKVEFLSKTAEDTERIGEILGGLLPPDSVVVLTGPLGSGKTIFVKGMATGLHITDPVVSPSYTIAALYEGDLPLTHIDLYRTGNDEELELLGFDEISDRKGITAIEWGEKADRFLDESAIRVSISIGENDERRIVISNVDKGLQENLENEFTGANS